MKKNRRKIQEQVCYMDWDQFKDQDFIQVHYKVQTQVYCQVRDQVWSQIGNQVVNLIKNQMNETRRRN